MHVFSDNSNGNTLVSVLVSSVLVGMTLNFALKTVHLGGKGMASVTALGNLEDVRRGLALHLANLDTCDSTLSGKSFLPNPSPGVSNAISLSAIKTKGGVTIASTGMKLGGGQALDKLELRDFEFLGNLPSGASRYTASLAATSQRKGDIGRTRNVTVGVEGAPISGNRVRISGCFDQSMISDSSGPDTASCPSGTYVAAINFSTHTATCKTLSVNPGGGGPSPTPPPPGGVDCALELKSQTSSSVTFKLTLYGPVVSADIDGTPVTVPPAPSTTVDFTKSVRASSNLQSVATVKNKAGETGSCSVSYGTCPADRIVSVYLPATANEASPKLLVTGLKTGETVYIESGSGSYSLIKYLPGSFPCFGSGVSWTSPAMINRNFSSDMTRGIKDELADMTSFAAASAYPNMYGYIPDWIPQDNSGGCSFKVRIKTQCN